MGGRIDLTDKCEMQGIKGEPMLGVEILNSLEVE